jgi:hypothetical protein
MYDITFPPVDVVAVEAGEYVDITWGPYVIPPFSEWIKWCVNDEIAGRVGYSATEGSDMTMAMRFTPEDLEALEVASGHKITKIALGIGTDMSAVNSMELRIWEGGSSITNAGTLVYTQPLSGWTSFPENTMIEIDLTTPFVIDASKELRIGWNLVNTAGYPFGRDAGPVVAGKGDLFYCTDVSTNWLSHYAYMGWNYNYSIKAFVTDGGKSATVLDSDVITAVSEKTQVVSENSVANLVDFVSGNPQPIINIPVEVVQDRIIPEPAGTRGVIGYKLWRLQPGQETDPSVWAALTNVPVTEFAYTDFSWPIVPAGTYKWAVRTVYHGMVESDPAFSNNLVKIMKADEFTVNITTNSDDVPVGAEVTLTKTGNTYTGVSVVNNVIFTDVVYGTYSLKVTLAGFHNYTAQVVINGDGLSHDALLIEIIKAPTDPLIEVYCPEAPNALFTWEHELAGGKHLNDFVVFLNDIEMAHVSGGEYLFTNLPIGDYIAGVQAVYSSGKSSFVYAAFKIDCSLSVDDFDADYMLYPNPTSDHLTVQRVNAIPATLDIYNAMGTHVATYETAEAVYEINVSTLSAGTYFIRITEGANSSVKSFVKK